MLFVPKKDRQIDLRIEGWEEINNRVFGNPISRMWELVLSDG